MAESKPGVILHLHGGAMIIGSSVSHRPLAWRMARDTGCRVFLPNYRLAPEDAYPSGLIDSLATYLWLIDDGPNGAGYSPEQVVIGGDSAGLAISLLYVLRDSLLKQPAGAYLWSPWVDITHSSKSWITNGQSDYLPNPRTTKTWRADDPDGREHFYVHKRSLMHSPYVSPLFGDADRLAPILVQTGAGERLIDECLEYGRKVNTANLKSGTPTRLEIYEEMPHVWQLFSFLPSAKEAIRRTALFVIDAQQRAINNNSPIKMKGWCVQVDSNGQAKTISW
ncbi:Alpha/Beta hydrolase protein [Syncephalis fuscata]|nr:Alpha/Beta hydrolase protein [Syncephalis fuscata]